MMHIPKRIPGLKLFIILWGVYGIIWIALEGSLWRVVLMGILTTAVLILTLIQKYLGGRMLSWRQWLGATAVAGTALGLGSSLMILIFMAVKTGLHAHGPEFSQEELTWVLQHIPLWTAVGLLAGLGFGLITSQFTDN